MIVVTGAAGFIGSNIAAALQKNGHDVVGIDDFSFGSPLNVPNGITFIKQDFSDVLPHGGSADDILIHCATANIIYAIDNPVETFNTNALKTIELFRRFRGRIIYTSTSSVYGNADEIPTKEDAPIRVYNAYDTSKRIAELYLMQRGHYTTLRLSNVYGENQLPQNPYCGVIGKLINCALNDKIFHTYGLGLATRDYTYVGDVVEAVQKAVLHGSAFTEVNIGTGDETSAIELIRLVGKLTGKKIAVLPVEGRKIDLINRRALDVSKAYRVLQWRPSTHLGAGLIKTIEWYKNAQCYARV